MRVRAALCRTRKLPPAARTRWRKESVASSSWGGGRGGPSRLTSSFPPGVRQAGRHRRPGGERAGQRVLDHPVNGDLQLGPRSTRPGWSAGRARAPAGAPASPAPRPDRSRPAGVGAGGGKLAELATAFGDQLLARTSACRAAGDRRSPSRSTRVRFIAAAASVCEAESCRRRARRRRSSSAARCSPSHSPVRDAARPSPALHTHGPGAQAYHRRRVPSVRDSECAAGGGGGAARELGWGDQHPPAARRSATSARPPSAGSRPA